MNEIKELLERKYTYEEGMAMLARYSRSAIQVLKLAKNRNADELDKALRSLSQFNLSPNSRPIHYDLARDERPCKAAAPSPRVQKAEKPKDDVVNFSDLNHFDATRLEDMTTPEAQNLWHENRANYKELGRLHEKMKQANSDAGRADFLAKIYALNEKIKATWKKIDAINSGGEVPTQEPGFDKVRILSYIRKQICKVGPLSPKVMATLQSKYNELKAAGVQITSQMATKLKEIGIQL